MNQYHPQVVRLVVYICSIVVLAGCSGVKHTMKPRVTLADISIKEIKTLESAFQIELRILNPNETDLKVSGLECNLKIDGKHFASGVAGKHYNIQAYDSATIPVTVYASVLDMLSSVIAFVQSANKGKNSQLEPLRYELDGHIHLSGGNFLVRTLPFATEGELSLDPIR